MVASFVLEDVIELLALISGAILSGAHNYKDFWLWCVGFSQVNHKHFRRRLVKGRCLVPSLPVVRNVMIAVTPEALQRSINEFRSVRLQRRK